jgi:7-keto-8-aminopelargonate synthetase-like enzyme
MGATPQQVIDLATLRAAVKQAQQSVMLPSYAREALAASFRLIESQQQQLQELREAVALLRTGLPACGLKPGAC